MSSSRIIRPRGIRFPSPKGTVLARSESGKGAVSPHTATGGIQVTRQKLLTLKLKGDIKVDNQGKVTVIGLESIPLNLTPLTDQYVVTYDSGTGTLILTAKGSGGATAFTDLTDVPASYTGAGGKFVKVNAGETGLEFVAGGGGVTNFTDLGDVPASYTGQSLKAVRVNSGETALEFYTPSGGSYDHNTNPPFEGGAAVPAIANFAWVNQGSSTGTGTATGINIVTQLNNGGTAGLSILKKSAPTAPYDIYARFSFELLPINFSQVGIILRNSTSGRLYLWALAWDAGAFAYLGQRWASATSYTSDTNTSNAMNWGHTIWLRMNVTSTTITLYTSYDGFSWMSHGTETISSYLTATGGSADEIGFCALSPEDNAHMVNMTCNCFDTSAPT